MRRKIAQIDMELQEPLGRAALRGLDDLLTAQPAGDMIATERVGAIVRLIVQALDEGRNAR